MTNKILVISGPSGVGKTTIINKIIDFYKSNLRRVITTTTRSPRKGEVNGIDYYFVSVPQFKDWINRDLFIEHQEIFEHWYGTLKSEIEFSIKKRKIPVCCLDTQGFLLAKKGPYRDLIISIFITAPIDLIISRLKDRGADNLELRKKDILDCIEKSEEYDHIIENIDLEDAVYEFSQIVDKELLN